MKLQHTGTAKRADSLNRGDWFQLEGVALRVTGVSRPPVIAGVEAYQRITISAERVPGTGDSTDWMGTGTIWTGEVDYRERFSMIEVARP